MKHTHQKMSSTVCIRSYIPLLLSVLCLFGFASSAYAQSLPQIYFEAPAQSISPTSEFAVRVLIDSEQEVNALALTLEYSTETLELVSITTGSSLVDVWRILPQETEKGDITLEGGLSTPFAGSGGVVVEMNFSAKRPGLASWSSKSTDLYYADGKGTLAEAVVIPLTVSLSEEGSVLSISRVKDVNPPRFVEIRIAENPVAKSRLVVFQVSDNESGTIETYFRSRMWFVWSEWERVSNPVELAGGLWSVQLRSVDESSNEVQKTLYIWPVFGIRTLSIIVLLIIVWIVAQRVFLSEWYNKKLSTEL